MEYETGKWYGWNGGECPVHPQTVVDAVWRYADGSIKERQQLELAGNWTWDGNPHGTIIAFRVITPYVKPKKPREFWAAHVSGRWRITCQEPRKPHGYRRFVESITE